jgi:uncharacterized protein YbjT (DUF2867 family)
LHGVCDDVDRIFSCLGASAVPLPKNGYAKFSRVDVPANRALIAEAKRAGVKKFAYVSTFHTPNLRNLEFVRAHERVVEELKASGLDYSIIRPTGFFSAMEEILLIASLGLLPEYAGGKYRTNPIHESDLAVVCADALFDDIQERDVGGPEPLTRKEIARLAYHAIGKADSARRVPVGVLALAGRALRPFNPRIAHLFTFIAKILVQDVVAPCHGTRTIGEFFQQKANSEQTSHLSQPSA